MHERCHKGAAILPHDPCALWSAVKLQSSSSVVVRIHQRSTSHFPEVRGQRAAKPRHGGDLSQEEATRGFSGSLQLRNLGISLSKKKLPRQRRRDGFFFFLLVSVASAHRTVQEEEEGRKLSEGIIKETFKKKATRPPALVRSPSLFISPPLVGTGNWPLRCCNVPARAHLRLTSWEGRKSVGGHFLIETCLHLRLVFKENQNTYFRGAAQQNTIARGKSRDHGCNLPLLAGAKNSSGVESHLLLSGSSWDCDFMHLHFEFLHGQRP